MLLSDHIPPATKLYSFSLGVLQLLNCVFVDGSDLGLVNEQIECAWAQEFVAVHYSGDYAVFLTVFSSLLVPFGTFWYLRCPFVHIPGDAQMRCGFRERIRGCSLVGVSPVLVGVSSEGMTLDLPSRDLEMAMDYYHVSAFDQVIGGEPSVFTKAVV